MVFYTEGVHRELCGQQRLLRETLLLSFSNVIFQFEPHKRHSVHFRYINVVGEESVVANAADSIIIAGYHSG